MALSFREWLPLELEIVEGTVGGATYNVTDPETGKTRKICYNFDRAHYRACRLLNDGESNDYFEISDETVNRLVEEGAVTLNTDNCLPEYGYLGAEVWDAEGEFVATIGDRCAYPAGYGTDHVGWGRCKYHGGAKIGERTLNQTTHGLTARMLRTQVQKKITGFLSDPAPLDLGKELATQRALLEMLLDHIVNRGDMEYFMSRVPGLMELIDSIGNMANKAALIEKRYAMTAAQVIYVQNVFVDIITRYVESPSMREEIASELARRLGSAAREANMAIYSARLIDAEIG